MDALIRRFSCLPLLGLALGLSGCQSSPVKQPQAQPAKQTEAKAELPGLSVFNNALLAPPQINSIVREGNHVTYIVLSVEGEKMHSMARFDADCQLPDAQMAYLSTVGMVPYAADPRGKTPEARQLPPEEKERYLKSAQLKQVCAQTPIPQWRIIAAPDHQDWQLIDRASLNRREGQLFFWSARVPAAEALMPRAKNLYSHTRQRWSADCTQQQLTSLSTFYLDQQSRVMGGQVLTTLQPVASPALGTEERQLLKLACGSPQTLEQYPPYLGREQTPFVLPAPALPASVLKSIEALKLPAPQLSLQHLRLSFKDFNEANKQKILLTPYASYIDENQARWRAVGRQSRDTTYLPYEPGTQLTERYSDAKRQSVRLSFRGLTELAKVDYVNDRDGIQLKTDTITDLRFEGDWANMPVGAHLSFTTQRESARYQQSPKRFDRRFDCQVESEQTASELFASLKGMAKVLNCTGDDYHLGKITALYAYLQTYGMFVPVDLGQVDGYGQFKIEQAE
jgi:hypothetical protein